MSILFRKLRHKIGAKLFEPETKMNDLCDEMITPQSGEYRYIHEFGSILELILYWVCDSVAIFKKETTLLINFNQWIVNEISTIKYIVVDCHG